MQNKNRKQVMLNAYNEIIILIINVDKMWPIKHGKM